MKHFNKLAFLFSISALAHMGCSSGGDTINPPATTTTVDYKTSTTYTYSQHARDSNDVNTSTADVITSKVLRVGITYPDSGSDMQTNVTEIQNVHTVGDTDKTYIAQKDGQFKHYNFGLEGFESLLDGSLGWVLQAKLDAKAGDTWVAKPATSVTVKIAGNIKADVTINAKEMADTTMMIGTETVQNVKHVVHTVTVTPGGITSNIDTYVSAKYGVLATIRHSTKIDLQPFYSGQVPGSEMIMTSHP